MVLVSLQWDLSPLVWEKFTNTHLKVKPEYKDKYSVIADLRTMQDWIVQRQMAMVEGVVEVNAIGGKIKQYEVAVDPNELKAIGLTITDVFECTRSQ